MKTLRTHLFLALLLAITLTGPRSSRAAEVPPETQTIVVANRNVPASMELADYYMKARGMASNQLCVLELPTGETMSRGYYEDKLRDPLLAFLRDGGWCTQVLRDARTVRPHESGWTTVKAEVRYIVCVYGVPLRIADTRLRVLTKMADLLQSPYARDTAAVDSELAGLLHDPYEIQGRIGNPLYNQMQDGDLGGARHQVLIAARLDGPTPETVRREIDDALFAERYGLAGRGFFDARGLTDGPYLLGDYWIRESAYRLSREGYDAVLDLQEGLWGELYPMEHACLYYGWYADNVLGPFALTNFAFARGAIAYHNHSANAKTLRSTTEYWAGPLLARGAACTMGAVNEPFLGFTPNLQIFTDRLCRGLSFGDSAYMAMPAISWQITVVGDPLYRPFRYSLLQQIEHLQADGRPEIEWAWLRQMNMLAEEGRLNVALQYCRQRLQERPSRVLREKMADLYAGNELYVEAIAEYRRLSDEAETDVSAIRIGTRGILLMRFLGRGIEADAWEKGLRDRWAGSRYLPLLTHSKP